MGEGYNGWTNRETWNTALWMQNDEYLYEESRRIVAEHVEDETPGDYEDDIELDRNVRIGNASKALKDWWEESFDPSERGERELPGPIQDAWQYAVDVTDWYEIAKNIAEDMLTPAQRGRDVEED